MAQETATCFVFYCFLLKRKQEFKILRIKIKKILLINLLMNTNSCQWCKVICFKNGQNTHLNVNEDKLIINS